MRLCDERPPELPPSGQLSFVESMAVLDAEPRTLGCDRTIVFFNDSERFHWEKPDDLVDVRSGVVCSPEQLPLRPPAGRGLAARHGAGQLRRLAPPLARGLPAGQANRWYERIMASAARFVRDFRSRIVATDTFTPTTIQRFTGHENGAVYGARTNARAARRT